jgi:competence protein ComEA
MGFVLGMAACLAMPVSSDSSDTAVVSDRAEIINLNSADVVALQSLKGIGPVRAQSIVEHREKNGPYKSVDDLANVDGISSNLVNSIRTQVTV